MKYKKFNDTYFIRLEKGEEINTKIKKFCENKNIRLGYFSGLGAVDKVELGLFNVKTKEYKSQVFEKAFEISALTGNISQKDGSIYLHTHITVADDKFNTHGGHMAYARVSATCEIVLKEVDGDMQRYFDDDIGLNLYNIK